MHITKKSMPLYIFLSQSDYEDVAKAGSQTVFGIFVIQHEGADLNADPEDVGIVLEGREVLSDLGNVPFAVAMLLALA